MQNDSHDCSEFMNTLHGWRLPEGGDLLDRLNRMIRPALLAGQFGTSFTRFVAGIQYHLGGRQDTAELASLARVGPRDHVLDVCCFLGGPAIQLAHENGCTVTGIDLSEKAIAAATRLAELAGLGSQTEFKVADATNLPFSDGAFSVVWNQCSLEHDEVWLREHDRVLGRGGRLAITFQLRGRCDQSSPGPFSRWRLDDMVRAVQAMGYYVEHAEDITARDVRIGWEALDAVLTQDEREFARVLGDEWVSKAHRQFAVDAEAMRGGQCGNGRIVATKQ